MRNKRELKILFKKKKHILLIVGKVKYNCETGKGVIMKENRYKT